MTLSVDYFWSVRSPYSYLASGRVIALADEYDLEIRTRPVQPAAIRTPEFFDGINPMWPRYLLRDTVRVAAMNGIPYRWPRPDPVAMDLETREISDDQPHVHRLSRLAALASETDKALAYIDEVSRLIWNGEVDGWDQGEHLARAVARAGLDLAEMDERAATEAARLDAVIEANQEALYAAGHWGVPTLIYEGEPFFGQDRIDMAVWHMKSHGLARRAGRAAE